MKTEQTTTAGVDPNSVRKVVSVQAPQAVAWRVFTEKMGAWWPLTYYKIGKANAVDAVIEPRDDRGVSEDHAGAARSRDGWPGGQNGWV